LVELERDCTSRETLRIPQSSSLQAHDTQAIRDESFLSFTMLFQFSLWLANGQAQELSASVKWFWVCSQLGALEKSLPMNDEWKLWNSARRNSKHSMLLRYGTAMMLTLVAVVLILRVPGLIDDPYFVLLGGVVLSAFYGGIGPSVLSLGLCVLAVVCLFLPPYFSFSLMHKLDVPQTVRLIEFGWVSLIISLLIAGSRRSRKNLSDSEERYRLLVQTAPDAIITVNAAGLIVFVTPASEKLFHCSREQMIGLPLSMFIPGCFCQSHLADLKRHLDTRLIEKASAFTGRNLQGEAIPLEITFSAFYNQGQNMFSAFVRDRTHREMRKGPTAEKATATNEQSPILIAEDRGSTHQRRSNGELSNPDLANRKHQPVAP
jgi:PAS domain S-box-containing protein